MINLLLKVIRLDIALVFIIALLSLPSQANDDTRLAYKAIKKGQYAAAVKHYKVELKARIKESGLMHNIVAGRYLRIANTLQLDKRYGEAISYYQKAIVIYIKLNGTKESREVMRIYNSIGSAYLSMGNTKKSLYYYEKDLAFNLNKLGSSNSVVKNIYAYLGIPVPKSLPVKGKTRNPNRASLPLSLPSPNQNLPK